MFHQRKVGWVLAMALILTPACGVSLKKNWGKSFEAQRAAQVLNPGAGRYPGAVEGLDGEAVSRSMEAYRESFGQAGEGAGASESLFDTLTRSVKD